ncbi:MAG: transglutaminase family protein [Hyphomicrobiales bacterium]
METRDTVGVVQGLPAQSPEALYLRVTPMTEADAALRDFAAAFAGRAPALQRAHDLMAAVHKALAYEVGTSHAGTTAVEAFKAGRGVCQDHAHVMIAAARRAGFPARYVTGYLVTGVGAGSAAAHAWAEVFITDLGWVGFDAANGQCPTDHYVRLAGGLDATAVPPIRGSRRGLPADEHLRVEVSVDIAQQ